MLFSLLPALVVPLSDIAFIIKHNATNGRDPPSCTFLVLVTPFGDIAFINKEATDAVNEEGIGASQHYEIQLIVYLFHVSFY